jgi:ERF superfamily
MATRRSTAAVDEEAPTPETAEAEQAERPKQPGNMEFLRTLVEQMRSTIKAELSSEIKSLRTEMTNLETLVTAGEPDGAAITLEEDALNDKIESLVDAKLGKIDPDLRAAEGQIASLASEFSTRLQELESQIRWTPETAGAVGTKERNAPAILGALWNVMRDVTYVPKGGTYEGGNSGSYKFRRFDDVAKELGESFRRHGVFLKPDVVKVSSDRFETVKEYRNGGKSVQTWSTAQVEMVYTFVSLVDGSEQSVSVLGEGRDLSDKATAKALTMALKTALTQAFMLPSDAPDPDSERPGDDGYEQAAQERISRYDPQTTRVGEPEEDPADEHEATEPPEVRAANALAWARKAKNLADLSLVMQRAREAGLTDLTFEDGETLHVKLWAIRRTLPGEA